MLTVSFVWCINLLYCVNIVHNVSHEALCLVSTSFYTKFHYMYTQTKIVENRRRTRSGERTS